MAQMALLSTSRLTWLSPNFTGLIGEATPWQAAAELADATGKPRKRVYPRVESGRVAIFSTGG